MNLDEELSSPWEEALSHMDRDEHSDDIPQDNWGELDDMLSMDEYPELQEDEEESSEDDEYFDMDEIEVQEYKPFVEHNVKLGAKPKKPNKAPQQELTQAQKDIRNLSQRVTRFNNAIRGVEKVNIDGHIHHYTDSQGNPQKLKINEGETILITLRPQPNAPIIHANAHPTRSGRPRISDSPD